MTVEITHGGVVKAHITLDAADGATTIRKVLAGVLHTAALIATAHARFVVDDKTVTRTEAIDALLARRDVKLAGSSPSITRVYIIEL